MFGFMKSAGLKAVQLMKEAQMPKFMDIEAAIPGQKPFIPEEAPVKERLTAAVILQTMSKPVTPVFAPSPVLESPPKQKVPEKPLLQESSDEEEEESSDEEEEIYLQKTREFTFTKPIIQETRQPTFYEREKLKKEKEMEAIRMRQNREQEAIRQREQSQVLEASRAHEQARIDIIQEMNFFRNTGQFLVNNGYASLSPAIDSKLATFSGMAQEIQRMGELVETAPGLGLQEKTIFFNREAQRLKQMSSELAYMKTYFDTTMQNELKLQQMAQRNAIREETRVIQEVVRPAIRQQEIIVEIPVSEAPREMFREVPKEVPKVTAPKIAAPREMTDVREVSVLTAPKKKTPVKVKVAMKTEAKEAPKQAKSSRATSSEIPKPIVKTKEKTPSVAKIKEFVGYSIEDAFSAEEITDPMRLLYISYGKALKMADKISHLSEIRTRMDAISDLLKQARHINTNEYLSSQIRYPTEQRRMASLKEVVQGNFISDQETGVAMSKKSPLLGIDLAKFKIEQATWKMLYLAEKLRTQIEQIDSRIK